VFTWENYTNIYFIVFFFFSTKRTQITQYEVGLLDSSVQTMPWLILNWNITSFVFFSCGKRPVVKFGYIGVAYSLTENSIFIVKVVEIYLLQLSWVEKRSSILRFVLNIGKTIVFDEPGCLSSTLTHSKNNPNLFRNFSKSTVFPGTK